MAPADAAAPEDAVDPLSFFLYMAKKWLPKLRPTRIPFAGGYCGIRTPSGESKNSVGEEVDG